MRMTKVATPPLAPAAIRENEDDTGREGPKCQLRLYDLGKDENADDDDAFFALAKTAIEPGLARDETPLSQRCNARCVQHTMATRDLYRSTNQTESG